MPPNVQQQELLQNNLSQHERERVFQADPVRGPRTEREAPLSVRGMCLCMSSAAEECVL